MTATPITASTSRYVHWFDGDVAGTMSMPTHMGTGGRERGMAWHGTVDVREGAPVAVGGWCHAGSSPMGTI